MIGTIRQSDFDIDHREAGNKSLFQGFTNTFFNGRNVLSRDGAAKNLIDEFKGFTRRERFDIEEYVTELTVTATMPAWIRNSNIERTDENCR